MSVHKTNAMRILDKAKLNYSIVEYDIEDGKIDGVSVAEKTGQNIDEVYKTLVTVGASKELYVFVIPVAAELSLKKAAKVTKEKKVEMIHVNDILKYTGYIRGGCSPVGMKKLYKTFIHEAANNIGTICISGGKKGMQIRMSPTDLFTITKAQVIDLIQE